MRKCSYCYEEIQEEAIKCKHCGSFLNENNQNNAIEEKEDFIEKYKNWVLSDNSKRGVSIINIDKGNGEIIIEIDNSFSYILFLLLIILWIIPGIIYLIYFFTHKKERINIKIDLNTGIILKSSKYSHIFKNKYNNSINKNTNNFNEKKVDTKALTIIVIFGVIMSIFAILSNENNYNNNYTENRNNIKPVEVNTPQSLKFNISTQEKIRVVKSMIKADKEGQLWCKTITLNYKDKNQSESQWKEFADSWSMSIGEVKYLVEKCAVASGLGGDTSFLQGLLDNLNNGVIK